MRVIFVLAICMCVGLSGAEFELEKIEVKITDIDSEGGGRLEEQITFLISGELSRSLYASGLYKNDLAFWGNATELREVRLHVDPNVVDIRDFRLRPQPIKGCNAFTETCRGQIIIQYKALPQYETGGKRVLGTGLFFVSNEKPRTKSYTINPRALAFTTTDSGDIIIEKHTVLRIILPSGSRVLELNPPSEGVQLKENELTWANTILVRFSLLFQVEETLGKEVTDFFGSTIKGIQSILMGEQGFAIITLLIILGGGYTYITYSQRKK